MTYRELYEKLFQVQRNARHQLEHDVLFLDEDGRIHKIVAVDKNDGSVPGAALFQLVMKGKS